MVFRHTPTVLSWIGGPASSASNWPRASRIDAEQSSISLTMNELAERIMRRVMRCAIAFSALRTISRVTGSTRVRSPAVAAKGGVMRDAIDAIPAAEQLASGAAPAGRNADQVRVQHRIESSRSSPAAGRACARVLDDRRAARPSSPAQVIEPEDRRVDAHSPESTSTRPPAAGRARAPAAVRRPGRSGPSRRSAVTRRLTSWTSRPAQVIAVDLPVLLR